MMRKQQYSFSKMPGYKQRRKSNFKIWMRILGVIIAIPLVVGGTWFYINIIKNLPDISEIENFNFKQATVITDKHGEILYKLFEENRDYIDYERISPFFVNAIVATEDQRFRENPGVDRKGTLRAGITDVMYGKTQGGSTITQQLIKNIMLSPEKKIERKLKEIILAVRLSKYVKKDIKGKYNNLSQKELDKKVKEKILELYANLIFFGNNSYGVEIASQTYFAKKNNEIDILEASILAGLPQAPSTYDPYNNRALLMGELRVTDTNGTPTQIDEGLKKEIFLKIKESIDNAELTFKRDDRAILEFFKGLLSFKITYLGQTYQVEYGIGRKDTVLARMYEEEYITESEFKKHFFNGLDYEFSRGSIEIKAPHFVFWVISMLKENYDQDILRKEGLTIKTTLDFSIQRMAENAIDEQEQHLNSYEAGNASMLYMDSQNGDILAYVGSKDFNNEDIDGQVDIIQSDRQPGSTIKPLVYSLGFMKLALTLDSPIYDIKFTIAGNTPENADGGYSGLMPLKKALAGSRNIPAIKMFLAIGGETPFKNFLRELGVSGLEFNKEIYGYPLAIGAGEMKMIDLARAYSHLSAMGKPAKINPISEIRGSDGSILYKKQVQLEKQVIPAGVSYLMRSILSDKNNFPSGWVKTFSFPGISFATKSGTTNVVKPTAEGKIKLPRDAWLVNYTPTKIMINWAGNTDGSALRKDAFGGWLNSPIRKSFVTKLNDNQLIQDQRPSQMEVKSVNISNITGKLASFDTPIEFTKSSLGYINSLPTLVDNNVETIQIDSLCNGVPSDLTPQTDISSAFFINPESILPDRRDQGSIMDRWRVGGGAEQFENQHGKKVYLDALTETCDERNLIAQLGEISLDVMQPIEGQSVSREFTLRHQTKSPFKIVSMKLFLGTIELKSFSYNKSGNLIDINTVKIPDEIPQGTYPFKVIVVDEKGYSDIKTIQLRVVNEDTIPPYLIEDKIKITPKSSGNYSVVLLFSDDQSTIAGGTVSVGGEPIYEITSNIAVFEIDQLGEVSYEITDSAGNVKQGAVLLGE